jgi:hypothetical protein
VASWSRKTIAAYIAPRERSAVIMIRFRSTRSTSAPASGPSRTAGSVRAIIRPATANPAVAVPAARSVTSEVTARNPTQSPSEDTDIAARSRANGGWVIRSRRVAERVPRSAATSSATLDTP